MTTVAQLSVLIGANISGLETGINQANAKVNGFATGFTRNLSGLGSEMTRLGGQLSLALAPLTGFGVAGVRTAMSFESAMTEISARTGLVGADLQRIQDIALQMGADTAFSAQDAANAFLQLLSSGQSAEEAIATLPAVLSGAAASGEGLGATADTVTDIMAMFGLEATDAAAVVDALAQASGASSATMASLGQGFANVGGMASAYGLDVDRTAAILAIFSENGIKGSEAGTQLKSMLTQMTSGTTANQEAWDRLGTSLYDSEGNVRDLEVVLGEMSTALEGMPVEEQNAIIHDLAGSYGQMGLRALLGSISISTMEQRMSESATSTDVASAKMDTMAGALDSLGGSIETLMINVFTPFNENVLKPMAETLTEIVNGLSEWAAENPELATTMVTVFGGAALLAGGLTVLGIVASGVTAGIGAFKVATGLLGGGLTRLRTGLSSTGGQLLGFAGIMAWAIGNTDWDGVREGLDKVGEGFQQLRDGDIEGITTSVEGFAAAVMDTSVGGAAQDVGDALADITGNSNFNNLEQGLAAWGPILQRAWGDFTGFVDNIKTGLAVFVDNVVRGIESFTLGVRSTLEGWLYGFRQMILDATGGSIDIAPGLTMVDSEVNKRLSQLQVADTITTALNAQLASGEGVDLGTMLGPISTANYTTMELSLADLITMNESGYDQVYDDIVAGMGEAGKLAVKDALKQALTIGDMETVTLLTPLAVDLGIDVAAVTASVQNQTQTAAEAAQPTPTVGMTVTPLIDAPSLIEKIKGFISGLNISAVAQVALGVAPIISAIGNAVTGASVAPPLSVGTPYVNREGLAYLHQGEAVLTADQNKALRGARTGTGGGSAPTYVFNVNSYGKSPQELLALLRREVRMAGL